LPFGILGRPHATRGEISLYPFHPGGWRLDGVNLPLAVMIGDPGDDAPATIVAVRRTGDGFLLRFTGVSSREQAAAFTGRKLCLPRSMLPPLAAGEFYVGDLLGVRIEDSEGRHLGVVRSVYWNGAHDVMVIDDERGGERLLPAVPDFIVAISLLERRVVVNLHE